MRIAISSEGDNIDSQIDKRFGRCKFYLIVELNNGEVGNVTAVENQGAVQDHGAGIKAAQQIGELNIDSVITGSLGPKSTDVLTQLGIGVYSAEGSAKDAINKFVNHELTTILESGDNSTDTKQTEVVKSNEDGRMFIPIMEDKGMDSPISNHFGHAPYFGLYDLKSQNLEIKANTLDHSDKVFTPVDQVIKLSNPTIVFALGIGQKAVNLFSEKCIEVKTGDYKTVREVIEGIDNLDLQTQSCNH